MRPLALTMGDPAGIGGELSLRAWLALRNSSQCFVVLDDPDRLAALAITFGMDVPVRTIESPSETAAAFPDALPVLSIKLANLARPGHPDKANAKAVISSIEQAAALALS